MSRFGLFLSFPRKGTETLLVLVLGFGLGFTVFSYLFPARGRKRTLRAETLGSSHYRSFPIFSPQGDGNLVDLVANQV